MADDTRTAPGASLSGDVCTMTVTLRDTPGALARIAATLVGTPVLALEYAVTGAARAVAEVTLPRPHATRARHRLSRMVDTLTVAEPSAPAPRRPLRSR
ncbi:MULTISPECIES: hypothetical protein [unclassified Streptomyces]|uniref:hypothetical protein n=1 Tax=unclassified Streptomyces TaxID=2593676 RepID=UPI0036C4E80B